MTATILVATKRGATDFSAGQHMNPYSWSKEHACFVAWIEGYNAAKHIGEME